MRSLALFAILIAPLATLAIPHNLWEPPFYDGVAAQVDKIQITYDDIRREMAPIAVQVRMSSKDLTEYNAKMVDVEKGTIQMLVERALLVTEFKGSGYTIPAKAAEDEYRKQLKENFNDSTSDLVKALQAQGLSLPDYRKLLGEKMMVQALQEKFRKGLPEITPDQIEAYYKAHLSRFAKSGSVRLSVITFKPLADEPASVLIQTAKDIKAKALAGENFAKLGEEYNQEGNVDWGTLNTTDLSPELTTALKDLAAGQIAEPISLEGPKVLLVKLEERHEDGVTPLKEVSETIKKELFETQAKAAYDKWIGELKKRYFVKINE
jgi:hypothetical protein